MLVEDLSKSFTAERWDVAYAFYIPIDKDKQLLLRSLFEVDSSSGQYILRPEPLYNDLMSVAPGDVNFTNYSKRIEEIIHESKQPDGRFSVNRKSLEEKDGDLRVAVAGMFYAAKNRVYAEVNYFNELREIVTRINFSRSITFICLIYSFTCLLLWLICFLAWAKSRFLRHKLKSKFFRKLSPVAQTMRMNVWWFVFFFLAYFAGAVLAGFAFRNESRENNQRVFGYYTSIIAKSKETIENTNGS
jgi:hypothetical protein